MDRDPSQVPRALDPFDPNERGGRSGRLALALVAISMVSAVLWAHGLVPWIATGDGYAVYFPTVWALQDGAGVGALEALNYGYFRMPAYPGALFLASAWAGHVGRAVTFVGVGAIVAAFAAGWGARMARASWGLALTAALFFGTPCFLNMATTSTPDLACLAVQLWALRTAWLAERPGQWRASGALAALSVFFRFNGFWLVPFLFLACWLRHPAGRRRPPLLHLATGVLAPLAAWSAFSLATRGTCFWIPGAPTELPVHLFHPELRVDGNELWPALTAAPLALLARLFLRALVTGPVEVAHRAAGLPIAVAALLAIPSWWALGPRPRLLLVALLGLSWLPMAFVGFEPRYHPIPVLVLCGAAAVGLLRLGRHLPIAAKWKPILGLGALCLLVAARLPALKTQMAGQIAGAQFVASFVPWEEAASHFSEGCLGVEETAYRMTPFRFLARLHHRDRLCCCQELPTQSGWLRLRGYGSSGQEVPPSFRRVEVGGGTELVELFERTPGEGP